MWYIYTMEYTWSLKMNGMMSPAGKWVELEVIPSSEASQTQGPHVFSHMWKAVRENKDNSKVKNRRGASRKKCFQDGKDGKRGQDNKW